MLSFEFKTVSRLLAPIMLAALGCMAPGQSSTASYNGLHAIVGARIEIGDGHVLEKGTVVIKDGMIIAVGADAAVPRGADVVDGKGLTVYPGFIDAYTTKGYSSAAAPKPAGSEEEPDAKSSDYASAFMRTTVRNGIHPEARAIESLSLTDEVLRPYQSAGFTTILVAPSGGDMSGAAVLVNLSGRPIREAVVLANAGQTLGFAGRGFQGYPSSLMGHIAQLRQTFLDAQWYKAVDRAFQAGGIQRPPAEDALIALQPVLAGACPAIFDADKEYQIVRSINLSSEFSLKPIIAGGTEAWKQIDAIKKSGARILLSLGFGKEPGAAAEPASLGTSQKPDESKPEAIPERVEPAKLAERLRLYKESLKNASEVAKAAIPFALSTKGTHDPAEFMKDLRKAVEAGLTKEAALRSLTIDSAKIFGVDRQMGTIEVGKIANLALMTGSFLKADTKVKLLYVDGRKIDPTKKPETPASRLRFGGEDGN